MRSKNITENNIEQNLAEISSWNHTLGSIARLFTKEPDVCLNNLQKQLHKNTGDASAGKKYDKRFFVNLYKSVLVVKLYKRAVTTKEIAKQKKQEAQKNYDNSPISRRGALFVNLQIEKLKFWFKSNNLKKAEKKYNAALEKLKEANIALEDIFPSREQERTSATEQESSVAGPPITISQNEIDSLAKAQKELVDIHNSLRIGSSGAAEKPSNKASSSEANYSATLSTEKDLTTAIEEKDIETIKLLLDKNIQIDLEHLSSAKCDVDIFKLLLAQVAKNNHPDRGDSALHTAAYIGAPQFINFLLQEGENINAVNNNNETAMHIAVEGNKLAVVNTLLSHGIDRTIKNNQGETALETAKRRQSELSNKNDSTDKGAKNMRNCNQIIQSLTPKNEACLPSHSLKQRPAKVEQTTVWVNATASQPDKYRTKGYK